MLSTKEDVVSEVRRLIPHISNWDNVIITAMSQPLDNLLERRMLWHIRDLFEPTDWLSGVYLWSDSASHHHVYNRTLYLLGINDIKLIVFHPNYKSFWSPELLLLVDVFEARCRADLLFKQFIACPSRHTQSQLIEHNARVLVLLNPSRYSSWPCSIGIQYQYFRDYKFQFESRMKGITRDLISTYLGLLPLNLDVWTVLFIVNQLPEFDLVYDGAKVRIYERMRLFRDKCSAKVMDDGAEVRIYERMRLFIDKCSAKVVSRLYCSVQ